MIAVSLPVLSSNLRKTILGLSKLKYLANGVLLPVRRSIKNKAASQPFQYKGQEGYYTDGASGCDPQIEVLIFDFASYRNELISCDPLLEPNIESSC